MPIRYEVEIDGKIHRSNDLKMLYENLDKYSQTLDPIKDLEIIEMISTMISPRPDPDQPKPPYYDEWIKEKQ